MSNQAELPNHVDVPVAFPIWLTLRAYLASLESIDDIDSIDQSVTVAIAGTEYPRPNGDPITYSIELFKWQALVRAKVKLIRADAMIKALSEKA